MCRRSSVTLCTILLHFVLHAVQQVFGHDGRRTRLVRVVAYVVQGDQLIREPVRHGPDGRRLHVHGPGHRRQLVAVRAQLLGAGERQVVVRHVHGLLVVLLMVWVVRVVRRWRRRWVRRQPKRLDGRKRGRAGLGHGRRVRQVLRGCCG